LGWIEKYGTGIKRVRNMFTDYGLNQPLFELIPGGFAATVFAENRNVADNVVVNVVDNVVDKRRKKIISLLKENSKLSAKELSVHLAGVVPMTIVDAIRASQAMEL
jgi:predicted HTH transcriptional regulator